MSKKITLYTVLTFLFMFAHAQVKVSDSDQIDTSLILEVDNITNQGVLLPRLELSNDISDTTYPVLNPAEGLLIFHKRENPASLYKEGYYVWFNGEWRYLADNNNSVSDITIVSNSLNVTKLGTVVGQYETLDNLNVPEFTNNINGSLYNQADGSVILPPGIYTVHLSIQYTVPNLAGGIDNGINEMNFNCQLNDISSGAPISLGEAFANVTLRDQVKEGTMEFNFTFDTTESSNVQILPSLAHAAGGSYINPIEINHYQYHIQISK